MTSVSFFTVQLDRLTTYRDMLASAAKLNVYERAAMRLSVWHAEAEVKGIERSLAPIVWC
jgi:hypothetical protein